MSVRELKRRMMALEYESNHGTDMASKRRAQHKLRKMKIHLGRIEGAQDGAQIR